MRELDVLIDNYSYQYTVPKNVKTLIEKKFIPEAQKVAKLYNELKQKIRYEVISSLKHPIEQEELREVWDAWARVEGLMKIEDPNGLDVVTLLLNDMTDLDELDNLRYESTALEKMIIKKILEPIKFSDEIRNSAHDSRTKLHSCVDALEPFYALIKATRKEIFSNEEYIENKRILVKHQAEFLSKLARDLENIREDLQKVKDNSEELKNAKGKINLMIKNINLTIGSFFSNDFSASGIKNDITIGKFDIKP